MSHWIEGEYGDGDCSVKISAENAKEPYVILNLETYYGLNRSGGSHCDVVFITLHKNDNIFRVHAVELKGVNNADKKKIRENIQNKFPQTLHILKGTLLSNFGLNRSKKIRYCAVLAVPEGVIDKIGNLIKRDKVLFGELKTFDEAWITACGENVSKRQINIK